MTVTQKNRLAEIKTVIREIPDFPSPGILFRDITPVLADGDLFRAVIEFFVLRYQTQQITHIVGIDARGFILGSAIAYALGCGFVPVRKSGKLPSETLKEHYELEYGTNALELHVDSFNAERRVIIIDDLLATGGTALAAAKLVQRAGGEVIEIGFFIELSHLLGREKLTGFDVFSLIAY